MNEQFSIPVTNLESNPFDFLPLSLVPLPVGSVVMKQWLKDDPQEINEGLFSRQSQGICIPQLSQIPVYPFAIASAGFVAAPWLAGSTSYCSHDWVWTVLHARLCLRVRQT